MSAEMLRRHSPFELSCGILVLILGFLVNTPCKAAPSDTQIIRIHGPITAQTQSKLSEQLGKRSSVSAFIDEPLPAGLIVLLNSAGGDGEVAMAIGRRLRQSNAHIFVTGRCDSACVFILAGGVVRAGIPGALGVHAGRLTQTNPEGRITREIDARQNLNDSFRLTDFNSQVRHYFRDMGIGPGLLDLMLAHQTKSVYRLSPDEISRYNIYGFDTHYLNQRVTFYNKAYESLNINQTKLLSRTMNVPVKCRENIANNAAFISCYQQVIENTSNP